MNLMQIINLLIGILLINIMYSIIYLFVLF